MDDGRGPNWAGPGHDTGWDRPQAERVPPDGMPTPIAGDGMTLRVRPAKEAELPPMPAPPALGKDGPDAFGRLRDEVAGSEELRAAVEWVSRAVERAVKGALRNGDAESAENQIDGDGFEIPFSSRRFYLARAIDLAEMMRELK